MHLLATFATPAGGLVHIYTGHKATRPFNCVIMRKVGAAALTCPGPDNLFAHGPVVFGEFFTAGPGGTPKLSSALFGIVRPTVTRLVAVDSSGRSRVPQMNNHAFFIELPVDEVKQGISVKRIVAYSDNGSIVDSVDLGRG